MLVFLILANAMGVKYLDCQGVFDCDEKAAALII